MDAWNAAMRRFRYCEPRWHLRVKPALEAKQPAAVGIVRPAGARTAPPGSSVAAAVRWRSPLLTMLPKSRPGVSATLTTASFGPQQLADCSLASRRLRPHPCACPQRALGPIDEGLDCWSGGDGNVGTIEPCHAYCRQRLLEFRTVRLLCQILWVGFFCLPFGATGATAQPAKDLGWETYTGASGTRDDLPSRLFVVRAGPAEKGIGQRWTTADGRAGLSIYVLRNSEGHTPTSYLKQHLTEPQSQIEYKRVARDFFAVSKYSRDRILYRRCNFSPAGTIHCVDLGYPAREKRAWDTIVTRISRSLRPLHS